MKTITPQIRPAQPEPSAFTAPLSPVAPASVDLQIDTVVFHGFSRAESHRATAAFQQELTRLVTARGLPPFSDSHLTEPPAHLDAGTIRASATRPELTGTRAARALHGGLRA